jgi:hypothetical protein
VVHASGPAGVTITAADGSSSTIDGLALDGATSAAIFARTGAITRLDVRLG